MRNALVWLASAVYFSLLALLLPLLPLLIAIAFGRVQYVRQYFTTLNRLVRHIRAMAAQGSIRYYFESVFDVQAQAEGVEISGECIRCGKCCLERQCVFLEQTGAKEYSCGIYHSPLRRFSNCAAYPVSQRDINRYACPSYYAVKQIPIKVALHPATSR